VLGGYLKKRIAKLLKSENSKAEEKFAATQKRVEQALLEREKTSQEKAELVANLRSLRLAKEAADKKTITKKTPAKNKKSSRKP